MKQNLKAVFDRIKSFMKPLFSFMDRHEVWLVPLTVFLYLLLIFILTAYYCPSSFDAFDDCIFDYPEFTDTQKIGAGHYLAVCVGVILCFLCGVVSKFLDWFFALNGVTLSSAAAGDSDPDDVLQEVDL